MTACCLDCIDGSAAWRDERFKGRVIHRSSNEEYGMTLDSDIDIRCKMGLLFFLSSPLFFGKAIFRLGHLLCGYWAWGQGYSRALTIHRIERYHCQLDENGKKRNAPGLLSLSTRTALYSLLYFTDAAIKLTTLPLAAALATVSTLVAITNPFLARRYFAQIEELWSIDISRSSKFPIQINYMAPCMQSKRIWDQYNLYPSINRHNDPKHIHLSALLIKYLLKECQDYLHSKEYNDLQELIECKLRKIKAELENFQKIEDKRSFSEKKQTDLNAIKNALRRFLNNAYLIAEQESTSKETKSQNKTQLYECLKDLT
jgi:hypothetical protein